MGHVVVMAVMMVPMGPGRGLRGTTPDQYSCGEKSQRRARLGYISQCLLVQFQHISVPQTSIAIYVASGTPAPFSVTAVWWANEA